MLTILTALLSLSHAACVEDAVASCHDRIMGNVGSGNDTSSYACPSNAMNGAELTYRITPSADDNVYISVLATGGSTAFYDVDLFVEQGDTCGSQTCVNSSRNEFPFSDALGFVADGSDYFVTIDNQGKENTDFELKVGCSPNICPAIAQTRTCEFTIAGDTSNGSADMSVYGCFTAGIYGSTIPVGPELVYEFTPELSGKVRVELRDFIFDHDLIVLEDTCDPSTCMAWSKGVHNKESVTFDAVAGKTYFLVVEATAGTPGPFVLQLAWLDGQRCGENCRNGSDDNADGDIDCDDVLCADDPYCCDKDGDRFAPPECGGEDCDDENPDAHPQAFEVCDGADNDCDGQIDEGNSGTWYPDEDGDGWGAVGNMYEGCQPPEGYVEATGDCDDNDVDRFPGKGEICDGKDNDCDSSTTIDLGCDDGVPKGEAPSGGCGCDAGASGAAGGVLLLVGLVGLRRRREG